MVIELLVAGIWVAGIFGGRYFGGRDFAPRECAGVEKMCVEKSELSVSPSVRTWFVRTPNPFRVLTTSLLPKAGLKCDHLKFSRARD